MHVLVTLGHEIAIHTALWKPSVCRRPRKQKPVP